MAGGQSTSLGARQSELLAALATSAALRVRVGARGTVVDTLFTDALGLMQFHALRQADRGGR